MLLQLRLKKFNPNYCKNLDNLYHKLLNKRGNFYNKEENY